MSCNSEEYVKYSTFCMKMNANKDPWEPKVHVHTVEEMILICSEGTCTVINNGHTQEIKTPAFIWNRLGSFHAMSQCDPEAEAYLLCYLPQFFEEMPKELLPSDFASDCSLFSLPLTPNHAQRMKQLFLILFESPHNQRRMIIPCILYQIEQYLKSGSQPIELTTSCNYIVDVVDFIQHNWSEKLTIPELAAKFHVCASKLKRDFKHITTETIHGYQMRMQLYAARRLTNCTDLSLVQIASKCGFTDESHLIRSFRKYLGTTPGAARKIHQEKWNK